MPETPKATLYLIPNLLGIAPPDAVLPLRTIAIANRLRHFVAENAKNARALLRALDPQFPLLETRISELNEHTRFEEIPCLLDPLRAGHDLGLMSEAGCPGVADPGASLILEAHRSEFPVVALVGPSSVLLGLMASGLDGQRFSFHGYLPIQTEARATKLKELEACSRRDGITQIFIETPYRNTALLVTITQVCSLHTVLCVAADLTTATETVMTLPISEWKKRDLELFRKRPALFLLNAGAAVRK